MVDPIVNHLFTLRMNEYCIYHYNNLFQDKLCYFTDNELDKIQIQNNNHKIEVYFDDTLLFSSVFHVSLINSNISNCNGE